MIRKLDSQDEYIIWRHAILLVLPVAHNLNGLSNCLAYLAHPIFGQQRLNGAAHTPMPSPRPSVKIVTHIRKIFLIEANFGPWQFHLTNDTPGDNPDQSEP